MGDDDILRPFFSFRESAESPERSYKTRAQDLGDPIKEIARNRKCLAQRIIAHLVGTEKFLGLDHLAPRRRLDALP